MIFSNLMKLIPNLHLILIACLLSFSACSNVYVYKSKHFVTEQKRHKRLAILPFEILIVERNLPGGVTYDQLREQQKVESLRVQSGLEASFHSKQDQYAVQFHKVEDTNALLAEAGITYENMKSYSKNQLAEFLGVDAVVSGRISQIQLHSTEEALAAGFLFGASAGRGNITHSVSIEVKIHGATSQSLLWKCAGNIDGGVFTSGGGLANFLTKQVAKKFPYQKG
jgi:hypothetical protein